MLLNKGDDLTVNCTGGNTSAGGTTAKDRIMEQTIETKMRKLEIIVKTRENKVNHKKFQTYAVKMKDGKWVDTRFTVDVAGDLIPKAHSHIFVRDDMMNIDKRGTYPKLWIKAIDHIEAIERPLDDFDQYFE